MKKFDNEKVILAKCVLETWIYQDVDYENNETWYSCIYCNADNIRVWDGAPVAEISNTVSALNHDAECPTNLAKRVMTEAINEVE